MEAGSCQPGGVALARRRRLMVALAAPVSPPEPCTPAELRAIVHAGETDSDACERLLAQAARYQGALEVELGDGLAALAIGDRLVSLGFSNLGDYAREILGVAERTAQALAHLSRALRDRPLLRAAVRSGEVRLRNAQTVVPVAVGEAEAVWVERARVETVRALEKAVRAARAGLEDEDEEWTRFRVRLSPEDRAAVDEALAIAGRVLPGSTRPQRLEAMAQEYLAEHPVEAGDDRVTSGAFRQDDGLLDRWKARLEAETERWSYLDEPVPVPAPGDEVVCDEAAPVPAPQDEVVCDEAAAVLAPGDEVVSDEAAAGEVALHDPTSAAGLDARAWASASGFDALTSAAEIDARLRALSARRERWDRVVGYCAYVVKRSSLALLAGFATFEHYCAERLGLSARAVEQRAAVEQRIWEVPALHAAREAGLSYEKVRLLSRLPDGEIEAWVPRARKLTCVALRAALDDRDEAQMRAARVLRARVPGRVALLLQAAFRAVRAVEDRLLDDGNCLVRVARHFAETWRPHVRKATTRSQKIRERDLGRCQVPGCSRRAVHAHHIVPRSRGGTDDPSNLVALCGCHHLRGIHGGHIRVTGLAPDQLVWEVGGRVWADGDFGLEEPAAAAA